MLYPLVYLSDKSSLNSKITILNNFNLQGGAYRKQILSRFPVFNISALNFIFLSRNY